MKCFLPCRVMVVVSFILVSSRLVVGDSVTAGEVAAASASEQDLHEYVNALRSHIQRRWIQPEKHDGLRCVVMIVQSEQGDVLTVRPKECATPELAASVERAAYSASPLPLPKHPEHFQHTLKLSFVIQ